MHPPEMKTDGTKMSREQLLVSLQGHALQIPNLQALFNHWPQHVNVELECLRVDVDERLRM